MQESNEGCSLATLTICSDFVEKLVVKRTLFHVERDLIHLITIFRNKWQQLNESSLLICICLLP